MKFNITSIVFIFLLSIILMGYANGENDNVHQHHQGHSTTTPHMDHSMQVFFTLKDLKVGNTMPIFFQGRNPSSRNSPHFLPKEEADLIPFSPSKLPFLLQYFGISRGSSQAKSMEDTLRSCILDKPIQGETRICATSLESMLEFVQGIFGSKTKFKALSTQKNMAIFGASFQNYTIVDEPKQVVAPKIVACHTMAYPYVVYYCHHSESETKVFEVSLRGETGINNNNNNNNNNNIVEAVAVCHMDTSLWNSDHVSFRVLGIKPGSSPVCHFFPADNIVWVPSFDNTQDLGDNKVLTT